MQRRCIQNCKIIFEKHTLDRKQLVSICTDGAPSTIGYMSGFKRLVTSVAPRASFTHCMIQCFALAMKTLPSELEEVLQDILKFVNHISANATTTTTQEHFVKKLGLILKFFCCI